MGMRLISPSSLPYIFLIPPPPPLSSSLFLSFSLLAWQVQDVLGLPVTLILAPTLDVSTVHAVPSSTVQYYTVPSTPHVFLAGSCCRELPCSALLLSRTWLPPFSPRVIIVTAGIDLPVADTSCTYLFFFYTCFIFILFLFLLEKEKPTNMRFAPFLSWFRS